MKEEYEITCNPSFEKMFAVMKKCNGFWQQVGPRYTYKKNAEKLVSKLEKGE